MRHHRLWAATAMVCALAGPALADSATWRFEWQGANGYAMRGAMSYSYEGGRLVLAEDVTCFVIEGTRDGQPIGRWALTNLGLDTSWRLHFDPEAGAFLHDGLGIAMPQAWNMNGAGTDCGVDGFGFNLGNVGQDFCLGNQPVVPSRIAPEVPFPAVRDDAFAFPVDACNAPELLGLLTPTRPEAAAVAGS